MTGVAVDLLTTILITILAFMCGYSAGHKVGRVETRAAMATLVKTAMESQNKDKTLGELMKKGDNK